MRMKQITPFVPCTSLAKQLAFYTGALGFKIGFETEFYAFIHRDDVAIRLVQVDADVDLTNPERQTSFYIDVEGIDDLFADMKDALGRLDPARVRAPFDKDYGQREFHVADEDCTLVFFGQALG